MPRATITQENVRNDGADRFPRLKLETNETAFFCLFQDPFFEWVHEMRAIKIEGGVAQKEVKTRRDGSTYNDFKYEFVGRPICLGDSSILADKGSDPANCPACQAGNNPVQRYAANIIRYALNGQGQPRQPFGADILIWSFTARMFSELFQLKQSTTHGDLSQVDLRMVCEDGHWQRNKLYVGSQTAFARQPENLEQVRVLLTTPGNLATDEQLSDACGRKRSRDQIITDLGKIEQAARIANNAGSQTPESLSGNLDSILNSAQQGQQQGQQQGWGSLPAQNPAAAASQPQSDPFAAVTAQADTSALSNPGVGGWGEFSTPAMPEPEGQVAAVTAQADALFGQGPAAGGATTTATAAPAAGSPSPTAQHAAAPASEQGGTAWSFDQILNK